MRTLPDLPTIGLTPAERRLAGQISFEGHRVGLDRLRESCAASAKLARSLIRRGAIPQVRRRYFTDPEYNPGGRKSRHQVFRDNGCSDEEIMEDGNFIQHLRYMIHGPLLPVGTITGFRRIVEEDAGTTGMIRNQLRAFARAEVRRLGLDRLQAAEAFFMLTLECGEDLGLAASIRTAALSVRR